MDELKGRLAELAREATSDVRAPGAQSALRRARQHRQRQAGGMTALALVVVALLWLANEQLGGLGRIVQLPVSPAGDRGPQPTVVTQPHDGSNAFRPPAKTDPQGSRQPPSTTPTEPTDVTVPQPRSPVVVASGVHDGHDWRLLASTQASGGSGSAGPQLCLRMELAGSPTTAGCAPDTSFSVAISPDQHLLTVVGRAPDTTRRVRVEVYGGSPVEVSAKAAAGISGRFFAAFIPAPAAVQRVLALDAGGKEVARTTSVWPLLSTTMPELPAPPGGSLPPPPGGQGLQGAPPAP